jgi:hypothetical protein
MRHIALALAVSAALITQQAQAHDWSKTVAAAATVAIIVSAHRHQQPIVVPDNTTNYNLTGQQQHPSQRPIYNEHGRVVAHTWATNSSSVHPAVVYSTVQRLRYLTGPSAAEYYREQLDMGLR